MLVDETGAEVELGRDLGRVLVLPQHLEGDLGLLLDLAELVQAVEHEPDQVVGAQALCIAAAADVQHACVVVLGKEAPGLGQELFLCQRG